MVSTHLKNIGQNGNLPPDRDGNKTFLKPPPSSYSSSPKGGPLLRALSWFGSLPPPYTNLKQADSWLKKLIRFWMAIRGKTKKHQHKNTRDFLIPPLYRHCGGGDLDVLVVNPKNLGGRSLFCLSITKKTIRFGDLEPILRASGASSDHSVNCFGGRKDFVHHLNIYAAHTLQESKSLIQDDKKHRSQLRLVGG